MLTDMTDSNDNAWLVLVFAQCQTHNGNHKFMLVNTTLPHATPNAFTEQKCTVYYFAKPCNRNDMFLPVNTTSLHFL